MTKEEETHLSNFIQQERAEGLLTSNTMFAITLHRKIFGIKYNGLRGIFIKYGLMDEQGNTIGPHGVLSYSGLWERHTTDLEATKARHNAARQGAARKSIN